MSVGFPMSPPAALRRHEPGRSDHQARAGQRGGFRGAGDAEVDDVRAVLRQQDIRRLQVPVHHACGVDRGQAIPPAAARGCQPPRPAKAPARTRSPATPPGRRHEVQAHRLQGDPDEPPLQHVALAVRLRLAEPWDHPRVGAGSAAAPGALRLDLAGSILRVIPGRPARVVPGKCRSRVVESNYCLRDITPGQSPRPGTRRTVRNSHGS